MANVAHHHRTQIPTTEHTCGGTLVRMEAISRAKTAAAPGSAVNKLGADGPSMSKSVWMANVAQQAGQARNRTNWQKTGQTTHNLRTWMTKPTNRCLRFGGRRVRNSGCIRHSDCNILVGRLPELPRIEVNQQIVCQQSQCCLMPRTLPIGFTSWAQANC